MEAWPIEEAYVVRPVGSLLLAAAAPAVSDFVLRRLVGNDGVTLEKARVPTRATLLALAWLIGGTALGPSLAEASGGIASHAAAFLSAALAVMVDARVIRRFDARAMIGGFALSLVFLMVLRLVGFEHGIAIGAGLMLATGAIAYRPPPSPDAGVAGWALGGTVALLWIALVAVPMPLTEIRAEDAVYHGDATWRLRVNPWDGTAMLASGWAARERGDLDRAQASGREARLMGLPAGPALELEAEVLAARGDCLAARETFDAALRARASEAFESDSILAPLVLGGYTLPPTLVTECGGLDELPGVGDLAIPDGPEGESEDLGDRADDGADEEDVAE